jgi:hypothetical protein
MRAWLLSRLSLLVLALPGVTRGFAVNALTGGFAVLAMLAVPAWSGASAAPLMQAALTSQSGAPAADRCDDAGLRMADAALLAGRIEALGGEARRDHAAPRPPTLNRAAPANDDLRRFSRAF